MAEVEDECKELIEQVQLAERRLRDNQEPILNRTFLAFDYFRTFLARGAG